MSSSCRLLFPRLFGELLLGDLSLLGGVLILEVLFLLVELLLEGLGDLLVCFVLAPVFLCPSSDALVEIEAG